MALINSNTWHLPDINPDDLEYYEPSLKVTGIQPGKMLFCGILELGGIKLITGNCQDKEEQKNE